MKVNQDRIKEIVTEKWVNGCPMCGGHNWTVTSDGMVTPIQVGEDKRLLLSGEFTPLVQVACDNCGVTMNINALIAGAIEEAEEGK